MVMQPLVSVVIPCYAQARFLADAIESVLAQTYRPWEIIVVDDGSPDDVPAVTRAYPMVRLLRQENRGLSEARNRGLAELRGECVVFLDADDRLLPEALSAGVEALTARPQCAFVWGVRRLIDVAGNRLPEAADQWVVGRARYDLLLRQNIIGPPVVVMFRRSAVLEISGFDPEQRFSEDYELYLRIARTQDSWGHGQLVAEYRVHDANMSLNHQGMLAGNLRALDLQEPWIGDDGELRLVLEEGRRLTRLHYDVYGRMDQLSTHVRAKRWLAAIRCGVVLLFRHPRTFAPVLARRMKRALLPSST